MSIKSQKSLNEELSEIIERSYSVRTPSDDSLSGSDTDEDTLSRELLRRLSPPRLAALRKRFKRGGTSDGTDDADTRLEAAVRAAAAAEGVPLPVPPPDPDPLWLDREGFIQAINDIFETTKYATHAAHLYQSLDPLQSGRGRWRRLLRLLAAAGARRTRTRADKWEPLAVDAPVKMTHCKRETLVKLVSIERGEAFCYAAVTRGGRVGLYSGELGLLHHYEFFQHKTGVSRRVKNCWVTDAIYLPDVQSLVLSSSDRALSVWAAAALAHAPQYCIAGLPDVPTCLAYTTSLPEGQSELCAGSARGELLRVRFLRPRAGLFYTKSTEQCNHYYWMELTAPPHTTYVAVSVSRAHSRPVRRVAFAGGVLLSCSHDPEASLRARYITAKLGDYVFKVQRGISCFHYVPSVQLLATGGRDAAVRVWAARASTPSAVLAVPTRVAVVDVAVAADKDIVLGYCCDCWLHIWDLLEECLLQSIQPRFPFLKVLGKRLEFGTYCLYPGPSTQKPEEEQPSDDLYPASSRRGSSVCRAATGGLVLQPDEVLERDGRGHDSEFTRFARCVLLVTACDHIAAVRLSSLLPPKPPPGDCWRARQQDNPGDGDVLLEQPASPRPVIPITTTGQQLSPTTGQQLSPTTRQQLPPSTGQQLSPEQQLSPRTGQQLLPIAALQVPSATTEEDDCDLDTLLENAGLQGILQKEMFLPSGSQRGLHASLAELRAKRAQFGWCVSMGAPYLSLPPAPRAAPQPPDTILERYQRVRSMFPRGPLSAAGSGASTPRRRDADGPGYHYLS